MLVLSRKAGEKIIIGDDIEITITKTTKRAVKIAIHAPGKTVLRKEIFEKSKKEKS